MRTVTMFVAVAAILLAAGTAQADVIAIETVPVGDACNVADTTGYGAVDHNYNIGKYEITVAQYTEFLNYKAWDASSPLLMSLDAMAANNIVRTGIGNASDPYFYVSGNLTEAKADPVVFVNFWDACRFVNWLNNGQGDGDTETGAYTLNNYNGSAGSDIVRNPGARWAIPTIDEWYKAAYFRPDNANILLGGSGVYYDEPTASAYGTEGQFGNGWEWSESVGFVNSTAGRILGGGLVTVDFKGSSLGDPSYSSGPGGDFLTIEGDLCFRIIEIPEPATLSLLALGGLAILKRSRKKNA